MRKSNTKVVYFVINFYTLQIALLFIYNTKSKKKYVRLFFSNNKRRVQSIFIIDSN